MSDVWVSFISIFLIHNLEMYNLAEIYKHYAPVFLFDYKYIYIYI